MRKNNMRVKFIADVHHAFAQVERLLKRTEADLYLVTGDLVSRSFFRYTTAWIWTGSCRQLKMRTQRMVNSSDSSFTDSYAGPST
ncbi:MAG: metallophosphoesterase [Deltaproteobacteria bacterium]|nr:metallophosphoesterase [Deltaproteobacteria bacterium]MBW2342894.1 metallophosphoesterase [Deltaproteobacteria bacterium]